MGVKHLSFFGWAAIIFMGLLILGQMNNVLNLLGNNHNVIKSVRDDLRRSHMRLDEIEKALGIFKEKK